MATTQSRTTAKAPATVKRAATPSKTTPVKAKRSAPSKAPKTSAKAKTVSTAVNAKAPTPKEATVTAPKDKKVKVVRDSFTIPKTEFAQLSDMKKKALGLGLEVKKSELIRAGLMLLNSVSDAAFRKAMASVPTLKTGRPGKN